MRNSPLLQALFSIQRRAAGRLPGVRSTATALLTLSCVLVGLLTPIAAEAPLAGTEGSTLGREPLLTPQEIGDGSAADLCTGTRPKESSRDVATRGQPTGSANSTSARAPEGPGYDTSSL